MIDWQRFAALMRSHHRFLLTSHVRPDCDALGSELGMAGVLAALGKDVAIVNGQATPPNLAFIDPDCRIQTLGETIQPAALADRDLLLVLDTSSWAQLGPMGEFLRGFGGRKIVLDHHAIGDDLGAEQFKNVSAEATGRLVVEAADALDVPLTPAIATPLFAALATDTGWFRFNSTTAYTYEVAARLVAAGARPDAIFNDLYEQNTLGRIKLRGLILARIVTELEGRLAHTYVLKEDFAATGSLPSDTEDVINTALSIAGTEFAVIFVEQPAGGFKISFRSRCDLSCAELARQFGGGGHKAAAGAGVSGHLPEAQDAVLGQVRAALSSPR